VPTKPPEKPHFSRGLIFANSNSNVVYENPSDRRPRHHSLGAGRLRIRYSRGHRECRALSSVSAGTGSPGIGGKRQNLVLGDQLSRDHRRHWNWHQRHVRLWKDGAVSARLELPPRLRAHHNLPHRTAPRKIHRNVVNADKLPQATGWNLRRNHMRPPLRHSSRARSLLTSIPLRNRWALNAKKRG